MASDRQRKKLGEMSVVEPSEDLGGETRTVQPLVSLGGETRVVEPSVNVGGEMEVEQGVPESLPPLEEGEIRVNGVVTRGVLLTESEFAARFPPMDFDLSDTSSSDYVGGEMEVEHGVPESLPPLEEGEIRVNGVVARGVLLTEAEFAAQFPPMDFDLSDTSSSDSEASSSSQGSSTTTSARKRRERDTSWILKEPAPGGPEAIDVIPSFGGHRAFKMYNDPTHDKGVLSGHSTWGGVQDLKSWELKEESFRLVRKSGLSHLVDVVCEHLDMPLLTAFIERWQPDTNTFMLPVGEMSILLHDVAEILRVPITGRICTGSEELMKDPTLLAYLFLGWSVKELKKKSFGEGKKAPILLGQGILVDAIEGQCKGSQSILVEVEGFLMCLLGQTLFVDKTGDRVMASIYSLLLDEDDIRGYAWGAGTLAHLYRMLGKASRANCMHASGCLALLQKWIYEYFPCFRPRRGMTREKKSLQELLMGHRRTLDELTPKMVTWVPYGDNPAKEHPRSQFSGYIRFMDVVEPYRPVRCLRQFGYVQIIPPPMPKPNMVFRPADSISYVVKWGGARADDNWLDADSHVVSFSSRFTRAVPAYKVVDVYYPWYHRRSHIHILSPSDQTTTVHAERRITDTEFRQRLVRIVGDFYSLSKEEQVAHASRIMKEAAPLFLPFVRGKGDGSSGGGGGREGVGGGEKGKSQGWW